MHTKTHMVFHMLFRIYIQFAKESRFEHIITYKGLFYKTYYFVPAIFFIKLTNYNDKSPSTH